MSRFESSARTEGFSLLEVLVSLTVFAVGTALVFSLISASLGGIRKVQLRTRSVEHAQSVMELALLDATIEAPLTRTGDFEDGIRFAVHVEEYEAPEIPGLSDLPQNRQLRLLSYRVEMFAPDSATSDYELRTLKLVRTERAPMGSTQ